MNRKELVRSYKEAVKPAGVFRIVHIATGKSLVGTSPDVPAMLNRYRFQLDHGSHPDKDLQSDWQAFGAEAFSFETLDLLKPTEEPNPDIAEDLRVLKDLWMEKLEGTEVSMYPFSKRKS